MWQITKRRLQEVVFMTRQHFTLNSFLESKAIHSLYTARTSCNVMSEEEAHDLDVVWPGRPFRHYFREHDALDHVLEWFYWLDHIFSGDWEAEQCWAIDQCMLEGAR